MEENADKYLDELSRNVIGKSSLETPSFDFTKHVMSQVHELSTSKFTKYTPLISKSVWYGIAFLVVCVTIFGFMNSDSESHWLQQLNLSNYLSFNSIIPKVEVSNIMLYSIVMFAVMFAIQIKVLKQQLTKRFD